MTSSQWVYDKLRHFRAGIEAGISLLKRVFGLETRVRPRALRVERADRFSRVRAHGRARGERATARARDDSVARPTLRRLLTRAVFRHRARLVDRAIVAPEDCGACGAPSRGPSRQRCSSHASFTASPRRAIPQTRRFRIDTNER